MSFLSKIKSLFHHAKQIWLAGVCTNAQHGFELKWNVNGWGEVYFSSLHRKALTFHESVGFCPRDFLQLLLQRGSSCDNSFQHELCLESDTFSFWIFALPLLRVQRFCPTWGLGICGEHGTNLFPELRKKLPQVQVQHLLVPSCLPDRQPRPLYNSRPLLLLSGQGFERGSVSLDCTSCSLCLVCDPGTADEGLLLPSMPEESPQIDPSHSASGRHHLHRYHHTRAWGFAACLQYQLSPSCFWERVWLFGYRSPERPWFWFVF